MRRRDMLGHLLTTGAGMAAGGTLVDRHAQTPQTVPNPKLWLTRTRQTPSLTVPTGKPYQFRMVAKLSLDLNAGDYVDLKTHFEGTNDLGFNVMFARYLKESATLGDVDRTKGVLIAKPMGANITPDMHHGMLETAGDFRAMEDRTHHFMLIGYAASTRASSGDTITVSYTEMRAAVWSAS